MAPKMNPVREEAITLPIIKVYLLFSLETKLSIIFIILFFNYIIVLIVPQNKNVVNNLMW